MKKEALLLTWKDYFKDKAGSDTFTVDEYFMLSESMTIMPRFTCPFKLDVTMVIICIQGDLQISIGQKTHDVKAPSIVILSADEVIQYRTASDDFKGVFNVLSKRLIEDLNIHITEEPSVSHSAIFSPVIPLNPEELACNLSHFEALKNATRRSEESPRNREIIQFLLLSIYFEQHDNPELLCPSAKLSPRRKEICRLFLKLVGKNYKTERQVGFYAEKLSITPKYLSKLVKGNTGKSANEWIDEYVMLEAKKLLKSSSLTIQQISETLNFIDQSAFGKYFKSHQGISPQKYRNETP